MRSASAAVWSALSASILLTACARFGWSEPAAALPNIPLPRPLAAVQVVPIVPGDEPAFAWCDAAACPQPSRLDPFSVSIAQPVVAVASVEEHDAPTDPLSDDDIAATSAADDPLAPVAMRASFDPEVDPRSFRDPLIARHLGGLSLRFDDRVAALAVPDRGRLAAWLDARTGAAGPFLVIAHAGATADADLESRRAATVMAEILRQAHGAAVLVISTPDTVSRIVVTTRDDALRRLAPAGDERKPAAAPRSHEARPGAPSPSPPTTTAFASPSFSLASRDAEPHSESSP